MSNKFADVAELADALDLGSSAAGCAGSTPVIRRTEVPYKLDLSGL